jgi:L-amino acid N-acyltransferase
MNSFIHCSYERHAPAILDIFNDAIISSTAMYDYKPRSLDSMAGWFQAKEKGNFPVIGIEDASGALIGFASYGIFRAWPAYKYSVEHSVYVHKAHRGKGIGLALMRQLIEAARILSSTRFMYTKRIAAKGLGWR